MKNSSFIPPFSALELVLENFLDEQINIEAALEAVEHQFSRVTNWLESLEAKPKPDFAEGKKMFDLGFQANNSMLSGLEALYEGIENEDVEGIEEAAELLMAGEEALLESLELCSQIEKEAERTEVMVLGDMVL